MRIHSASLLNLGFVIIDAHGLKTAQNKKCAVDVVDAPATKPTAIRLLFLQDELNGAFDALV